MVKFLTLLFFSIEILGGILEIKEIKVFDKDDKEIKIEMDKSKFTLIILLSQKTCIAYFKEKETWEKMAKEYKKSDLSIYGILIEYDENYLKYLKEMTFPFEVYLDKKKEVYNIFKPKIYPMKYLFSKDGKLLFIDWPSSFDERKNHIHKEIKYLFYLFE